MVRPVLLRFILWQRSKCLEIHHLLSNESATPLLVHKSDQESNMINSATSSFVRCWFHAIWKTLLVFITTGSTSNTRQPVMFCKKLSMLVKTVIPLLPPNF